MPVSRRKSKLVPYWQSSCGRAVVYVGDCRDVMVRMEPEQFHAVVTDPPYNLTDVHTGGDAIPGKFGQRTEEQKRQRVITTKAGGFMGHTWDSTGVERDPETWVSVMRVAKPGAHLLSFGGTRTWHRMVCAVEDAGWEIRDTVMWVYGSGFPKGQDISKAIDKLFGAERTKIDQVTDRRDDGTVYGIGHSGDVTSNEPITDAAKQWSGWNTSLKPSYEPVIVARKPLPGTVAQCVLDHGCGGINIGACRVGSELIVSNQETKSSGSGIYAFNKEGASFRGGPDRINIGRHPANLIHDGSDEVVELFPETEPSKASNRGIQHSGRHGGLADLGGNQKDGTDTIRGHDDKGGSAARFFYTAKADGDDRPHGKEATTHPTVKPLDLMRYLVRLVCAKGGTVLDPFMGSGSTGCAAIEEGMRFVGIEQDEKYADIAVGRLKLALQSAPPMVELQTGQRSSAQDSPHQPKKLR